MGLRFVMFASATVAVIGVLVVLWGISMLISVWFPVGLILVIGGAAITMAGIISFTAAIPGI